MNASLNSKLYTVAALREIATRMGLTVPSKAVKAEVVALIVAEIDRVHADYVDYMDRLDAEFAFLDELESDLIAERAQEDRYNSKFVDAEDRMRNRVQNYMDANGTDKLTPAQLRRIRKNANRHGVNPWAVRMRYSYAF